MTVAMFFMKSHMVNSVEYILYYKIGLYFFMWFINCMKNSG